MAYPSDVARTLERGGQSPRQHRIFLSTKNKRFFPSPVPSGAGCYARLRDRDRRWPQPNEAAAASGGWYRTQGNAWFADRLLK